MKISIKKAAAAGLALSLGLGLAGFGATAASAAVGEWTPNGTPEPYYIWTLAGDVVTTGTTLHYGDGVVAVPSPLDPDVRFADAPAEATTTYVFIAPIGKESSMSEWLSRFDIGFEPGTKRAYQPTAQLSQFPSSTFAAVKAAGGDYSLGFAYTANNGVTFVGLGAYTHVHITPGTADWTADYPEAIDNTPVPTTQTGQIGIEATTVGATDGQLSLTVPTGAKATLGAASLVNGLSTSTGTLPTFTVDDGRVVSKPGWTLNSSVADFTKVGAADSFTAAALSVTPAVVTSGTTSTGVTAVAGFAASNTAAKFAEAAAGFGVGTTALNAGLTLVAPVTAPAGTYTSTMTVTVISK